MSIEEIKEKLNTEDEKWREFVPYGEEKETIGGLEIECVSSERGSLGDHDQWQFVFRINERLFALYGYYDSNNGVDFDDKYDFQEVKPVEKKVIVYEAI